jgi:leucyl-tRNA synthetase
MLAPIAPHISEELWADFCTVMALVQNSVHLQSWPSYNPDYIVSDTIELPVQVNGKVRGRVQVAADACDSVVADAAKAAVASHIEGKEIRKMIVVPGRIVTIVV